MSIRAARAADHWRRALARTYQNRYQRLRFADLFCLGAGDIQFRGGITAIVGGNGVGKSTLAAALGELLGEDTADGLIGNAIRLSGSTLDCEILENGIAKHRHVGGAAGPQRQPAGDALSVESWWLDPAFWAFHTRAQVTRDQNFQDMLQPLAPIRLTAAELETVSYVVGKEYEECQIYEIADYADVGRFPYFRVRAHGVEYGSDAMGQGELSLLLVLWVLRDLRPNSILILEEPESHVSPRAQVALMNVIARACDEKGLWTIITTHSPTIVGRVPSQHVRLLVRDGANVLIVDNGRRHQLAGILGGGGGFGGVLLVEDDTALEMVVVILDEISPDLLRQFEIVSAGSASKITAALESFPKTRDWLKVMGVFDGDQRGKVDEDELRWPVIYLPGETGPDQMLRDALRRPGSLERFAEELGRTRADIAVALEAVAGRETHDWVIEGAQQLAVSKTEIVRAMTRVWLANAEDRARANTFVADLQQRYDQ